MRIIWFILLTALVTGCGSSGGVTGNAVDPGPGPGPAPAPSQATVYISTSAASAATIIYGVGFVLQLPAGVTVPAKADGEVLDGILKTSDSGVSAGARYVPATATARASVKVNIFDPGGFAVGELATLTCAIAPQSTVSATGFTLSDFVAKDADGAVMGGITPHFSVQTQ